MAGTIIECVPNFSEGRDRSKVNAIAAAIGGVAGLAVLDCHIDPDHNRSVVTLAGAPEAVAEGAFRGIAKAAELIDLRTHAGVHPRVGAADVVPLVPVEGSTLGECARLAESLGRRVWNELAIPVYFYEACATRPDRKRLENVRKGRLETLAAEMPDHRPDIGGPAFHPTAGATIVGARGFLVAYNIDLRTEDVERARAIARAVRASSGGLPGVKAMGLYLPSRRCAQVSMNLTDFRLTPPEAVFHAVRAEAARLGVELAAGELIGLVPRAALDAGREWFEHLGQHASEPVLEQRLQAAGLVHSSRQ